MDALELARWQFGITTVYHFFFVPITIGLSFVVALMQTLWIRTRHEDWLRLSKFFGKLFTINFALGLVTGIVQEFQFGMNWSDYSRFVGDIFGAPLAIEALLAFFLESTFLGLWLFGWGRIPEALHNAAIWLVHIGTLLSAYFILAANSFMQNPVGYRNNPETGRAELVDFWAVLTNPVQLVTFPHVATAAYATGAGLVVAVAVWHLWRKKFPADEGMYRKGARLGAWIMLVASLGVVVTGDVQGKIMTDVQPMKMAAAEALYDTEDSCASFSILTIGTPDGEHEKFAITVPCVLSFLATGDVDGKVEGINQLQEEYAKVYGGSGDPLLEVRDYRPNIMVTYWSFRYMMGAGALGMLAAAAVLWGTRGGRSLTSRWWYPAALAALFGPLLGNSFGWIFTEMGRQPWVVFGLMNTEDGVSPGVGVAEVLTSMVVFTLLYGALAVIEVKLMLRYASAGAEHADAGKAQRMTADDEPHVFAY
ncbi:cytochrome ubiquinol oxidase subunit I [Kytococcus schroeteri]|uniref:cytochrome ubiquinol oxidase subunit I n=1 Tax=Kytococcus schroeteri TaxID=138300 RepID=UPI0011412F9E|nr:cytochrome ubiquinol oxidase subunit I [Kytococcus schroeteri]